MVRVLVVASILIVAVLCVTRCEFDGGLLDKESEASRKSAEQLRAAARAAAERDYLTEHQSDIHTDVIAFAAALCSATDSFRSAVPRSSSEPTTVDAALANVRTDLAVIGGAARGARDSVTGVPIPATDQVLTPGTDAETWGRLRDRASRAFGDVATSADTIDDRLNIAEHSDFDAATTELRRANDAMEAQLTALAETVDDVLARLPIPNQETLTALRAAEVCGSSVA